MTTNDRYYTLVVAQYKKNKLIIIKRKIMQEELSWFDTGSNVRKKEKNWITDLYAHGVLC